MASNPPFDATMLRALAPHMDTHLYLTIIDTAYKTVMSAAPTSQLATDVKFARLQILERTALLSYLEEEYKDDAAKLQEVEKRKSKLLKRCTELEKACGPIISEFFIRDEEERLLLKISHRELADLVRNGSLGRAQLHKTYKVTDKHVAALYDLGFQLYECGAYDQGAHVLRFYCACQDKPDERRERSAQWGLLTCDSTMANWVSVGKLISQLRDQQDHESTPVNHRVWLLHASLFFYFRGNAHSTFLDHLFSPNERDQSIAYCQTIQSAAPHLMRYVVAAMILNKKKKSMLRRVARMVESESYQYSDAITQFLDALHNQSAFSEATKLLPQLEQLARNDFLLSEVAGDLVSKARQMLFEDQLRIHRTMSIPTVATQLGINAEEAELWLVHLVREAKMDATVDSVQRTVNVNVGAERKTAWRSVMEMLQGAERDA